MDWAVFRRGSIHPRRCETWTAWHKSHLLMQYSIHHQRRQTSISAELIHRGYLIISPPLVKHKVAECDVTVLLTRSTIGLYIIDVTYYSFCFPQIVCAWRWKPFKHTTDGKKKKTRAQNGATEVKISDARLNSNWLDVPCFPQTDK